MRIRSFQTKAFGAVPGRNLTRSVQRLSNLSAIALSVVFLTATAHAFPMCNANTLISYQQVGNHLTPTPTPGGPAIPNIQGSTDTVQLDLFVDSLEDNTGGQGTITITSLYFDLDCHVGTQGTPGGCAPNSPLAISYVGDATISSTCLVNGNSGGPVSFTSAVINGKVTLTANPAMVISGNVVNTFICSIWFSIHKDDGSTNDATPYSVEEDTGFLQAQCSNGLVPNSIVSSSLAIAPPTPTPTNAPTNTPANTPTDTPANTPTNTATTPPTNTPANTPTDTATNAPTNTPANTPTDTPANTPTPTRTPTATPTATITATSTSTPSPEVQTFDDCKNGGWILAGFANQGQCIASIAKNGHGR